MRCRGGPKSARSKMLSNIRERLGGVTFNSEEASSMAGAMAGVVRATRAKAGQQTQWVREAIGNRTAQFRSRGRLFGRQPTAESSSRRGNS